MLQTDSYKTYCIVGKPHILQPADLTSVVDDRILLSSVPDPTLLLKLGVGLAFISFRLLNFLLVLTVACVVASTGFLLEGVRALLRGKLGG